MRSETKIHYNEANFSECIGKQQSTNEFQIRSKKKDVCNKKLGSAAYYCTYHFLANNMNAK